MGNRLSKLREKVTDTKYHAQKHTDALDEIQKTREMVQNLDGLDELSSKEIDKKLFEGILSVQNEIDKNVKPEIEKIDKEIEETKSEITEKKKALKNASEKVGRLSDLPVIDRLRKELEDEGYIAAEELTETEKLALNIQHLQRELNEKRRNMT